VGGRTLTQKVRDTSVDLGGMWVGPKQKNVLALSEELGLKLTKQYCEGKKVISPCFSSLRFSPCLCVLIFFFCVLVCAFLPSDPGYEGQEERVHQQYSERRFAAQPRQHPVHDLVGLPLPLSASASAGFSWLLLLPPLFLSFVRWQVSCLICLLCSFRHVESLRKAVSAEKPYMAERAKELDAMTAATWAVRACLPASPLASSVAF
jgi:hypothetical protein